jgi:hypothetical protein
MMRGGMTDAPMPMKDGGKVKPMRGGGMTAMPAAMKRGGVAKAPAAMKRGGKAKKK